MIARVLLLTLFVLAVGGTAVWTDADAQTGAVECPVHADIDVEEETEVQVVRGAAGTVALETPPASVTSTVASSLDASPPTRPPRA